MNKRVHEIAKERGLTAKEVLAKLREAGIEVKAASSSVDEAVAARALGNGDTTPAAATPEKAAAPKPAAQPAADAAKPATAPKAPTAEAPKAPTAEMPQAAPP